MAEAIAEILPIEMVQDQKQENDQSYRKTDESGLGTQSELGDSSLKMTSSDRENTADHFMTDSNSSGKWEDYDGEIMNLATINHYLQSSNLLETDRHCEISAIEHAGDTPKLRKGKTGST